VGYSIYLFFYLLLNLVKNLLFLILNKYFLTKERSEAIARGNDAAAAAKIVEEKATERVEAERSEKEI